MLTAQPCILPAARTWAGLVAAAGRVGTLGKRKVVTRPVWWGTPVPFSIEQRRGTAEV